jgi:DNA-binding SARP family transcriptional activator
LGGPQCRALLSLLIVRRSEVASTEWIIDGLWGAAPPPSARAQVQNRVCRLRSAFRTGPAGTLVLETVGLGYRLRIPQGLLDLDVFRASLASAEAYLDQGLAGQAAAVLRDALSIWHDRPYADVDLPAVQAAAQHVAGLRLIAVERWAAAELTSGASGTMLPELSRLVAEYPYHERLRAHLMTALCMSGQAAEALAVYRDGRDRLVQDLGIEPSADLQALHHQILGGRQSLGYPAVSGPREETVNLGVVAIDQMRHRSLRREITS